MAVPNKFATMLHRNTNKIIVILVYALLEWVLISLLLLNSLFNYLINKYADFFGLKHSCIGCSSVRSGSLLQVKSGEEVSVWDNHAAEISKLSFCVLHGRLAKSQDMCCQDCSMEKWHHEHDEKEREVVISRCSLCNGILNNKAYPNSHNLVFKPASWGNHLDDTDPGDIIVEELDDDGNEEAKKANEEDEHQILSDVDSFSFREASEEECSKSLSNFRWHGHNDMMLQSSHVENDCFQVRDLQFMRTHCSDDSESLRVVPIDLIDSLMITGEKFQTLTMDSVNLLEEHGRYIEMAHHNTEEATKEELDKETTLLDTDVKPGNVKPLSAPTNRDNDEVQDSTNEEQEARENDPETPTSLDSLQSLHKKLLLLSEKRESLIEESLDGSVDGGDGALTVERLKSALTLERKTLRALYTELEEERSASAIAANHTMAMITRLQEEKAAMQMEALQYQRMMEEQAEYDQEALQLLNGLMLKREKEKDELEKELEMYRDQIVEGDYSNDDTRLSSDLNPALIEKHSDYDGSPCADDGGDDGDLEEMALDYMKHMSELDESLTEFEEEKLSILNQLKALEEKLLLMSCEGSEGRVGDDIEDIQKETMQSMAKQLLPLLDEAEAESAEMEMEINSIQKRVEFSPQLALDDEEPKKVDAVEEVDRVYERLQALKKESVREEDEGMNLLQEILQNLRDLKSLELGVQSTGIA